MPKQQGASRFFGSSNDDVDSSDDEVEIVLVVEPSKPPVMASNDSTQKSVLLPGPPAAEEQVIPAATGGSKEELGSESANQDVAEDLKQPAVNDDVLSEQEAPVQDQVVNIENETATEVRGNDVDTNTVESQTSIEKSSDFIETVAEEEKVTEVVIEATEGANSTTDMLQTNPNEESEKENQEADTTAEQLEPQKPNPFAQFAFGSSNPSRSASTSTGVASNKARSRNWIISKKETTAPPTKKKKQKTEKKEWIPLAELPLEEQQRVLSKWQGLSFDSFSLEDRRFQVMVASRLHARCQETVVRKCMTVLREAGILTCTAMAQVDPEVLASLLTSLQYYNTKSKHLVESSKQLLQGFGGMVPESKDDLLKLTGIGPVMADLLSNINTREAYQETA
jgi:endonuclease III